jgi:hypothetical protein
VFLSTLGGELGAVEYDFFDVIAKAKQQEFTRKDIDRAYRAASSAVFNPSGARRPKGSRQKEKNIEHHLERMREFLLAEPYKRRPFTAAKEVLATSAQKGTSLPTPRHLVRELKKEVKSNRQVNRDVSLKLLPVLASLTERLRHRPGYERHADECEKLTTTLVDLMNKIELMNKNS